MALAFLSIIGASSARAITAGEFVDNMDAAEQTAWVFGAAEMAAHIFYKLGEEERANCVVDWVESKESVRELDAAFRSGRKYGASAVLDVVLQRHCGKWWTP